MKKILRVVTEIIIGFTEKVKQKSNRLSHAIKMITL